MQIELIARTIQDILAPVVMVSACAILIGGMLSYYSSINERLRALARERLELLRMPGGGFRAKDAPVDDFTMERLREIDQQLPLLVGRHRLVHNGILSMYIAILCFVACMFVIGLAALTGSVVAANVAFLLFLGSTAVMLVGVAQIATDIRMSHRAVEYEAERVLGLGK